MHEDELDGYRVRRYRPRIEGLFARIERWSKIGAPGEVHWRSISKDNILTLYGYDANSRIAATGWRGALDRYLAQRRLPVTRTRWDPKIALVPGLEEDATGITASRLWAVMRRFFQHAAQVLKAVSPSTSVKLLRATPHWMRRHSHATHALARGVESTTVRDNLRHASAATTSVYLHTDEIKRARQMGEACPAPPRA